MLALLAVGVPQALARPDPPAADRLMDPTNPSIQMGHLLAPTPTPPPPTPSESAFKTFKKGPATFAEFCQLHPLTGKPLGQQRFLLETLAADVPTEASGLPGSTEPTAAMLGSGNLFRQTVFANTQAQTENVLSVDRQSDGSKLPTPAWEGQRLFTSLEQTDAGYNLAFTLAESRISGWLTANNTQPKPVLAQLEVNSEVSVRPDGQWMALDGGFRETPGNGDATAKQHVVVYIRLTKLN